MLWISIVLVCSLPLITYTNTIENTLLLTLFRSSACGLSDDDLTNMTLQKLHADMQEDCASQCSLMRDCQGFHYTTTCSLLNLTLGHDCGDNKYFEVIWHANENSDGIGQTNCKNKTINEQGQGQGQGKKNRASVLLVMMLTRFCQERYQ